MSTCDIGSSDDAKGVWCQDVVQFRMVAVAVDNERDHRAKESNDNEREKAPVHRWTFPVLPLGIKMNF
eukprot:5356721-Amphidinium_carterae.1